MGRGAAREKVRVAHALARLPLIDDALRLGTISYSKVRAMTRVATPATEEMLLLYATKSTAAQLEKMCRMNASVLAIGKQSAHDIEDGRRYVVSRRTDDGLVSIQIRVLPDEAARILAAIGSHAVRGNQADGAVAMAEVALRGDAGSGGTVRPPVEVVIHVAAETLTGVTDPGDGLPAETCRRLLCDCGVVPILEDAAGRAIDVGRKHRTIPVALRRALEARDKGCRFPGCDNRFVDGHHIRHWADGGATSLENTILLCRRHHRFVHEFGCSIRHEDGAAVFLDPTGAPVPAAFPRPPLWRPFERIDGWLRAGGVVATAASNEPGWDGLPVDYELCVDALLDLDRGR
jgi:hypothetical protein